MQAFGWQKFHLLVLCLIYLFSQSCASDEGVKKRPNIVYILADDLGFGDLSCYNASGKIKTPHLDSLARGGMRFTDAHSGSSVCTPTRYGILTGRYSWRSPLKHGVTWSWDAPLIQSGQTTVASLLKERGYRTACVGKWHLGLGWQKDTAGTVDITLPVTAGPNDLGFDYFFGITASLDIPPYIYLENNQSTSQEIDTIDGRDGMEFWRRGQIGHDFTHESCLPTLTKQSVSFIREQGQDQPFFLYFPLPAPHTPILPTASFQGQSGTNSYGDFVLMVDDLVGQITDALEEKGLLENTLFIFTSDNGCSPRADFPGLAAIGHHPSGIFRGHKADIFEGGHRVPFIAHWPSEIEAGLTSDQTICLTDLLATCAAIVGDSLGASEGVDSYNLLPLFQENDDRGQFREATVHHSINGSFAIRQGDWKLIFCPGSGGWSEPRPKQAREQKLPPIQLYNLENDPGETINVAEAHPQKVNDLTTLMQGYIDRGRSTPGPEQAIDSLTALNYAEHSFE